MRSRRRALPAAVLNTPNRWSYLRECGSADINPRKKGHKPPGRRPATSHRDPLSSESCELSSQSSCQSRHVAVDLLSVCVRSLLCAKPHVYTISLFCGLCTCLQPGCWRPAPPLLLRAPCRRLPPRHAAWQRARPVCVDGSDVGTRHDSELTVTIQSPGPPSSTHTVRLSSPGWLPPRPWRQGSKNGACLQRQTRQRQSRPSPHRPGWQRAAGAACDAGAATAPGLPGPRAPARHLCDVGLDAGRVAGHAPRLHPQHRPPRPGPCPATGALVHGHRRCETALPRATAPAEAAVHPPCGWGCAAVSTRRRRGWHAPRFNSSATTSLTAPSADLRQTTRRRTSGAAQLGMCSAAARRHGRHRADACASAPSRRVPLTARVRIAHMLALLPSTSLRTGRRE